MGQCIHPGGRKQESRADIQLHGFLEVVSKPHLETTSSIIYIQILVSDYQPMVK